MISVAFTTVILAATLYVGNRVSGTWPTSPLSLEGRFDPHLGQRESRLPHGIPRRCVQDPRPALARLPFQSKPFSRAWAASCNRERMPSFS